MSGSAKFIIFGVEMRRTEEKFLHQNQMFNKFISWPNLISYGSEQIKITNPQGGQGQGCFVNN